MLTNDKTAIPRIKRQNKYLADFSEGKMLRRMEVKGSDYLRPFATIQEVIAVAAATEATSTVEGDVPRS